MHINDILAEFGEQAGLPLALDANNTCRIVFDDRVTVDVEAPREQPDRIFVYAAVGRLPDQDAAPLLEKLLAANLFGQGTEGATLAVDSERREILLQRILAADALDTRAFTSTLEGFVRAAMTWQETLRAAPRQAAHATDALDPATMIRA